MKTIEYQLKSKPGKSIIVPEKFVEKAEYYIKLAQNEPGSVLNLLHKINEPDWIGYHRVILRTLSLSSTKQDSREYPILLDEVYLETCFCELEKEMRKNKEYIDPLFFDIEKELKKPENKDKQELYKMWKDLGETLSNLR